MGIEYNNGNVVNWKTMWSCSSRRMELILVWWNIHSILNKNFREPLFGTKICVLFKIATKLYIFIGCSAIHFPVSHHLIILFLQCHIFTIGPPNILTVPYNATLILMMD